MTYANGRAGDCFEEGPIVSGNGLENRFEDVVHGLPGLRLGVGVNKLR